MFVERLLERTTVENKLPPGARYDERLDLNVGSDGSPLVSADRGPGERVAMAAEDSDAFTRSKSTKADRDKPRMLSSHFGKQTRADRDKPRLRRLRAGKKTGADKDKPLARRVHRDHQASARQDPRQSRPMRAGDEEVTAVAADARPTAGA